MCFLDGTVSGSLFSVLVWDCIVYAMNPPRCSVTVLCYDATNLCGLIIPVQLGPNPDQNNSINLL